MVPKWNKHPPAMIDISNNEFEIYSIYYLSEYLNKALSKSVLLDY